ncbi:MAG: phosphate ABC transporter permease PstA [Methanomicrobiaceae archaeon]|nr:phosphate ABC transporter permease PstA [Methanomicrobiaceae archaeon]
MKRRNLEEKIFKSVMILSLTIVICSLLAVFATVIIKGAPSLSLEMITEVPKGGYYLGGGGGILNAIVGSLYLSIGAIVIAFILSLPMALYLNQYSERSRVPGIIRMILEVSTGIPSLIYGVFVFLIMIEVGARASLFWGIITIAVFITPILTRGMDEIMQTVPLKLKEASLALGTTRFETLIHVITRQALPGILTAVILAFGRGIGDAASVLFTAGYTDSIPTSLSDPVATLPLAIFFQLSTPIPEVQQRAYASAIILLVIVLLLSAVSRILSRRFMEYVVR